MDTVDRNYVESLIERAQTATRTAREVADLQGLTVVYDRLTAAADFLDSAKGRLPAPNPNRNGTTGPEHITDEGIELEPPTR